MSKRRRTLVLGMILCGLLILSVGAVLARSFPAPRPGDLSPGIHEEGLYVMIVLGTYGRLWPIHPFPYVKDDGKKDDGSSAPTSVGSSSAVPTPAGIDGKLRPVTRPPSLGGSKAPGLGDPGQEGGLLTPTGRGDSRIDRLDGNLRDVILRLNSK